LSHPRGGEKHPLSLAERVNGVGTIVEGASKSRRGACKPGNNSVYLKRKRKGTIREEEGGFPNRTR